MGDGIEFDIRELNRLAANLENAGREVLPLARKVVQKSAADIKRDGQAFAPVDTGFLRSSIGYETRQLKGSVEGEIGPTASYAPFVEGGTSRMAPHAFMGPALDRNTPAFTLAMAAVAREALDE